jgi:hypothetical protein
LIFPPAPGTEHQFEGTTTKESLEERLKLAENMNMQLNKELMNARLDVTRLFDENCTLREENKELKRLQTLEEWVLNNEDKLKENFPDLSWNE